MAYIPDYDINAYAYFCHDGDMESWTGAYARPSTDQLSQWAVFCGIYLDRVVGLSARILVRGYQELGIFPLAVPLGPSRLSQGYIHPSLG